MPQSSYGDPNVAPVNEKGAFMSPVLLRCENPWAARAVHDVEAFGPVSTLMPYKDAADAIALANRGKGSLVDERLHLRHRFRARPRARLWLIPRPHRFHRSRQRQGIHRPRLTDAAHDSRRPRPRRRRRRDGRHSRRHALHAAHRAAGPSAHALRHREAATSPACRRRTREQHPFRRKFHDLPIGYQLKTKSREITLDDIEHFAHFTGDTFYAHMDEEAAAANPLFGGRVAHGYLISRSQLGFSSIPIQARCSRTTASTTCASSNR
jgi:oxepin-CoA hydrolase/3-oxo-5,6-dehydrosuberyl-CoA semialdehyde dehydrogenase